MGRKIIHFAFTLTILSQVFSEDQDDVKSGIIAISTKGTTTNSNGLTKENQTEIMLTLRNTGELVDGMINTNISNSNQLNSVFSLMKKMNVKTTCNIVDYSLFVIKFCRKQGKDQESQDQEPPKGSYNSSIQIIQQTYFYDGLWTLRFSIVVDYKVELHDKKKYTTCSRKETMDSLKKYKAARVAAISYINNTKTGIEGPAIMKKEYHLQETRHNEMDKKNERKKSNEPEQRVSSADASKKDHMTTTPKRAIFIKIIVKPTRKLADLKEGETLYYTFFDLETACVVIKAGNFRSGTDATNKTITRIDKLNLVIEASAKDGEHTYLVYDSRFKHPQLDSKQEIMTDEGRQIKLSSNCDASGKVIIEKEKQGTMFSFAFSHKQPRQDNSTESLNKLLVYVSDEKKKEEQSATATPQKKSKVISLSGYFHVRKESKNTVIREKQVETWERVRKVDCNLTKTIIEQWFMDEVKEIRPKLKPRNKPVVYRDMPFKLSRTSKLITCGGFTFELSREENFDSSSPTPKNIFVFYMTTRRILNENGKQLGKEDRNEEKLRRRTIFLKSLENVNSTYETLELMAPAFEKQVQTVIADVKKSISIKYGESVWNNAEYKSELKINRKVACSAKSCQGSIKAVLQYNLTKKARPDVRPKGFFKMLTYIRLQFNTMFVKQHPLAMALMKRKPNRKDLPAKIPMTKIQQVASPSIHTRMPPGIKKVVPNRSVQKLQFKATGPRQPLSRFFSHFGQNNEFKDYQKMERQFNQGEKIRYKTKNPFFQVINKNKYRYHDGEIIYDRKQVKEVLKKVHNNKPKQQLSSAYAATVGKSIIIAFVNCLFLFVY